MTFKGSNAKPIISSYASLEINNFCEIFFCKMLCFWDKIRYVLNGPCVCVCVCEGGGTYTYIQSTHTHTHTHTHTQHTHSMDYKCACCARARARVRIYIYIYISLISLLLDKTFLDCDMACHKKCEKLTGNLCGLNQKLVAEALQALKRSE